MTEASENKEMLLNQAEEFEHHSEEFESAVKKSDYIPAWVVAKSERASTDLSDITHYLDGENEQREEMTEGEEEYADGGEIKWQDAHFGDNALVVSENKMGLIIKPYGRKFHLRFPDGSEKTYDASELKFFGDMDDFDMGGKMAYGGKLDVGQFYKTKEGKQVRYLGNTKDPEVGTFTSKADGVLKVRYDEIKGKASLFEDGGEMEEGVDLFEDYDDIPSNVQMVLEKYPDAFEGGDYRELEKANKELGKIGYTFEYGLDGQAYDLRKIGERGKSEYMAKGGMVVTSIKDIPNFKQRLEEGKITYRGMGMGKKSDDFYDLAGENGKSIKVDGKEYHITDTEFDSFSRGADGKLRIRFDAPYRTSFAKGGYMAKGGKVKFADKVKSIKSSLLERKKVSPKVQKDYGKTYSPKEAEESAKRIVGAMTAKERLMAKRKKSKK
jgi:hypothetical protein